MVRCCVEEVERRGMDEVGIYRVSGGALDISTLKAAFDSSKDTNVSVAPPTAQPRAHTSASINSAASSTMAFLVLGDIGVGMISYIASMLSYAPCCAQIYVKP